MARLFGTDGVRGVANDFLTPELAVSLAAAAVAELGSGERPLVYVGRDPRPSGELLEAAVVAGVLAAGGDVVRLGVIPTPAVALAVARGAGGSQPPAALGIMISASHNPMPDNGIKLFGPGGGKVPDDVEDRIEARLGGGVAARPTGGGVGRVRADLGGQTQWYISALTSTVDVRLGGLRVVVDCANGAAAQVGPAAYRAAGADVTVLNDDLSGYRINDGCGATHLDGLQAAVVAAGADVGLAHDGDADRCLAVDATGTVVDGDQILAVLALGLKERGRLAQDAVAVTVMSNLGFRQAMAAHGIAVEETAVGDRYVLERMVARGLSLGGEQSGHTILRDLAPTGDGVLTGLHLLARMAATGRPLADLAAVMRRLPQALVNVTVADKQAAVETSRELAAVVEAELRGQGRVLVRPSGTEPLLRVMVEAPTQHEAQEAAERIAAAVRA
ncbi:MAG: phosphoglucosamine mutase [Frankiaceae bacterium]|jgi:phosphoglucosamine mutase|nr:phosphoglucosamine mutase [Frankiaceae bacterium]